MPDRYASPAACHRRFHAWVGSEVFEKILRALAEGLRDRGELDLSECFIDATFVGAKKGSFVRYGESPRSCCVFSRRSMSCL
jgi:hypothetical protein